MPKTRPAAAKKNKRNRRNRLIVALDQGTSSTRAVVYDAVTLRPLHMAQRDLPQHYPCDGQVEHDAQRIWADAEHVLRAARDYAAGSEVVALGITNQRETVLLWERATARPLHRAIVWQDRRTAARCAQLKAEGAERMVRAKTGLLLDPYFSATKLSWLLDETGSRTRAARGEVLAGTIDTYLVWMLTGGKVFATDVTNASRTMLFSLADMAWDDDLLELANVPRACLPEVRDCADDYGHTGLLGNAPVPICGVVGDQQAAAVGQACLQPGEAKSTYGTGCFMIVQAGQHPVIPENGLLGTVGYRVPGRLSYAIEGSIFAAGTAVKWLRDRAGLIGHVTESESLAAGLAGTRGAYMVPAFSGLGAPHWNPDARAAFLGISADTGRAELVRAALESVAYQTCDLMCALGGGAPLARLRIDGGMAVNNWFAQFLADTLDVEVSRPQNPETTAAGAAFLAGLQAGVFASLDDAALLWQGDRNFVPNMAAAKRDELLAGWRRAVAAVTAHAGTR